MSDIKSESPLIIETERLRLRRLTVADAPFMLRLLNEPSFIKNIGDRNVRTMEDARAYIEDFPLASYAEFGFGPYFTEERTTKAGIGICGLRQRPAFDAPDIGYALLPEYWGRGYAYEASVALMSFAKSNLGIARMLGFVNPDNVPSIRLLEKLGFTYSGKVSLNNESDQVDLYISDM
jgi:RimJ/RimL family protein N-acetyltransferase